MCFNIGSVTQSCQLNFIAGSAMPGSYLVIIRYSGLSGVESNLPTTLTFEVTGIPSPEPVPGTLVVYPFDRANIHVGESTFAKVTLSGSIGIENPVIVNITNSDASIATLESSVCYLTSANNTCTIVEYGIADGRVTFSTSTPGSDYPNETSEELVVSTPISPFDAPLGITYNGGYVYITNFNSGTVSSCSVSNGLLSGCKDSGADASLLEGPSGVVLNSAGTFAYIVNRFSNTVTACSVEVGGVLAGCVNSNILTNGTLYGGITLNATGNMLFITDIDRDVVIQCSVSGKSLTNCTDNVATTLYGPFGITLNQAGTMAFVAEYTTEGHIMQCPVIGNNALGVCSDTGATDLSSPSNIVLNPSENTAFIANQGGDTIVACTVAGGVLSNCLNSGAAELASPFGIVLTPDGVTAFITNFGNNMVSTCRVSGTTLSNCAYTGFY